MYFKHLNIEIKWMKLTFIISGSFHGPLSESIHPPLSTQVHVPPKNSGSSLMQGSDKQVALGSIQELLLVMQNSY